MSEVYSHVPKYTLEEKEEEIIIVIVAPLSEPKEGVFVLEKNVLTFESPPYLLKIKLPHAVSDGFSKQSYDIASGSYKIKLQKCSVPPQEESDDEDEEISNAACSTGDNKREEVEDEEKQFYGFANMYSNMFGELYNEFSEVINLPDPDHTCKNKRRMLREKEEAEKWSDDHYLADTMEIDHLESIFKYTPPWVSSPVKDDFRSDEREILTELVNKSKITSLSKENKQLSEFQIVDVLFGYAYNVRTTEGENTVESGWTINKLSSTLHWLEVFEDLKSVLLSCYKRSLTFPLYRNWKLTEMIHKDVAVVLKTGFKQVTRCLLEVRDVFKESYLRDILNTLYINDLCNFAFHLTDEKCAALGEEVEKVEITKHEVNPEIPLVERSAFFPLEERAEGETMDDFLERMAKMYADGLHYSSSSSNSPHSEYYVNDSSAEYSE